MDDGEGYRPLAGPLQRCNVGRTVVWDVRTDTVVTVETLVYSLKQHKLVWGGQSRTTNPNKVDDFVSEVAMTAAKELRKEGLIGPM